MATYWSDDANSYVFNGTTTSSNWTASTDASNFTTLVNTGTSTTMTATEYDQEIASAFVKPEVDNRTELERVIDEEVKKLNG